MTPHPETIPQNSAAKDSTLNSGSLLKMAKPYTGLGSAPRRPSGSFETNTTSSTSSTPASTRARKMSAHTPTAESQHAALASASKLGGMFDSLLVPVHTGNTPPRSPQTNGQSTRRARSMSQGASSRPGTPGPGNETPGRKTFIAEAMNTSRAKTPVSATELAVEPDVKTPARTPVPVRTKTPVPARAKTPVPARAKGPVPTRAKTPVASRPKTSGAANVNVYVPSDEAPMASAPGMASAIESHEPLDQPMASPPGIEIGPQLDEAVSEAIQPVAGPSNAKTGNGTKKSLVQSKLAFDAPAANKTPGMRRMTRSTSQKVVPTGPLVTTTVGAKSTVKALGPGKGKDKDGLVHAASVNATGDDAMVLDEVAPSNTGSSSTFLCRNGRSSRCRLFRPTAIIHTRQDASKSTTTTLRCFYLRNANSKFDSESWALLTLTPSTKNSRSRFRR